MAEQEADGAAKLALGVAVILIIGAVIADTAALAWLVGILVLFLLLFVVTRVPLRYALMGIMFVTMTLENPAEAPAAGLWKSPLYPVGALMLTHMNQTTGVSWMSFSGCDVLLMYLMALTWLRRKKARSTPVLTPKPLIKLAFLSLAGSAFVLLRGMLRDGDFSKALWQLEKVTYLPILFLLFQVALRGPQDYPAVAKVILGAALVRALLAIFVMRFADLGEFEPAWATTHHDSMLFACAIVILVSALIHRAHRSAGRTMLLVAPVLIWGMVENNRRMVWVQILLVFVTLFAVMPINPVKRKIKRYLLLASPAILAYIAVGWTSSAAIFKPVQTIRSVVEPANDVSTMTRDIENYNIAKTIAMHPFGGLGYGHAFLQLIQLPPMPYPLEPWLPHNSLLGLWFASGFIGYTAMTLLWTAGVYFGVRAYRASSRGMDRATALVSFGSVLIYLIQCYGDIGLGSPTGVYMVAVSLAIAGQLALLSGAWPKEVVRARKAAPVRATAAAPHRRRTAGRTRDSPQPP